MDERKKESEINRMSDKVAVLVSCFSWYENRLVYINEYLKRAGYTTYIVISDFSHSKKKRDTHLILEKNLFYIHVPEYKENLSIRRLWSHKKFSKEAVNKVVELSPNLVYALIPPNSITRDIAKTKQKLNFRLVFDVIDLWPESMPLSISNANLFLFWKNLRNKYINNADLVVLECSYYNEILKKYVDKEKFKTFHLVKPPLECSVDFGGEKFDGIIRLAYLGSMNNLLDIDGICRIVKQIRTVYPVEVYVIGKGEKANLFLESLKRVGANVNFYGTVYEDEKKFEIFRNCQFGLNIYKQNIKVGLTIKSIDYMQLGLPLLNNIKGDTYDLVNETGIGINLSGEMELNIATIQMFTENIAEIKTRVREIFCDRFSTENIDEQISFLKAFL